MAIIKCPECGHQVSDKAATCPSCGVGIQGKITKCPECGEIVLNDQILCPNCHCPLISTNNNDTEKWCFRHDTDSFGYLSQSLFTAAKTATSDMAEALPAPHMPYIKMPRNRLLRIPQQQALPIFSSVCLQYCRPHPEAEKPA